MMALPSSIAASTGGMVTTGGTVNEINVSYNPLRHYHYHCQCYSTRLYSLIAIVIIIRAENYVNVKSCMHVIIVLLILYHEYLMQYVHGQSVYIINHYVP